MRPLIAGNWKMHGLGAQLAEIELIAAFVAQTPPDAEVLLCLPATLLSRAVAVSAGRVPIGGEDCRAESAGSFTGDVSADMLKDAGASSVIVGHSERRRLHHETDAMVAAKARAAWTAGLSTIICIGETQAQRSDGIALAACASQIEASLPDGLPAPEMTAIAYEPLWAIGSGHVPAADEIAEVHLHIRSCLTARAGAPGELIRILYGGSATSHNAGEILRIPEVDGLLIGGASLQAEDLKAVLRLLEPKARPQEFSDR